MNFGFLWATDAYNNHLKAFCDYLKNDWYIKAQI